MLQTFLTLRSLATKMGCSNCRICSFGKTLLCNHNQPVTPNICKDTTTESPIDGWGVGVVVVALTTRGCTYNGLPGSASNIRSRDF